MRLSVQSQRRTSKNSKNVSTIEKHKSIETFHSSNWKIMHYRHVLFHNGMLDISFAIFTLVGYATYESATATSTPVR